MTFEEQVQEKDLLLEHALLPEVTDIRLLYIMKYLVNASNLDLDEDTVIDSFFDQEEVELREEAYKIFVDFKNDMKVVNKLFDDSYSDKIKYLFLVVSHQEILIDDVEAFIDSIFPEEDFIFYREALDTIFLYNTNLMKNLEDKISGLEKTIKDAKDAKEEKSIVVLDGKEEYEGSLSVEVDSFINILISLDSDDDKNRYLNNSLHSISALKIRLLEIIRTLDYRFSQYNALTVNVDELNKMINTYSSYKSLLDFIKEFEVKTRIEEEEKEEKNEGPLSRVVFVPNNHNSTYLYEDITDNLERKQDIKQELNKIFSGYFLRTKHIKPLQGYDNLWEYFNKKNQVRILFIKKNGIYYATSLFFKKTQKSIGVSNLYEEAIRRFNAQEDSLNDSDSLNFMFEQQEYISELNEVLTQKTYVKGGYYE